MPKIQNLAQPRFPFIFPHHFRFNLHRPCNHVLQRLRISHQKFLEVFLQKRKQSRVRNNPVLDHFRQPAAKLPFRQTLQHRRIHHHQLRRIKRANQILPLWQIHASFSADRTIRLRHQRRWHLHQRHPAQIARRGKSRHIAYHSAAHHNHHRVAIRPSLHQAPRNPFHTL